MDRVFEVVSNPATKKMVPCAVMIFSVRPWWFSWFGSLATAFFSSVSLATKSFPILPFCSLSCK